MSKNIIFVLFLVFSPCLFAEIALNKTIEKTYSLSASEILAIRNKYGKVHINSWDKQEVQVKISITSIASTDEKAKLRLEGIELHERRFGPKLELETWINQDNPMARFGNKGLEIAWEVSMPSANFLEVRNQLGDIFLDDRKGGVDLTCTNGSLVAKKLENENNTLQVSYGNIDIAEMKGGTLKASFGKLILGYAQKLNLNTNAEDSRIYSVEDLTLNGSLGGMEIEEVGHIRGNFNSSGLKIQRLKKSADVNVKYIGDFNIKSVDADFEKINITSAFSAVNINMASGAAFGLDTNIEHGSLTVNDKLIDTKNSDIKWLTSQQYRTAAGAENSGKIVNINSKYGNVKVKY